MNPLDWTGPDFLMGYALLLGGSFLGALVLRHLLRLPGGELPPDLYPGTYEVALLQGYKDFFATAVASLLQRKVVRLQEDKLVPGEEPPSHLTRLEREVRQASVTAPLSPSALNPLLKEEASRLESHLRQRGMVMSDLGALLARVVPALAFGAVLCLGLAKLLVGLQRDKPTGYLVFLLIAGLIAWIILLSLRPWRSRLGDTALEVLQHEHEALRTSMASAGAARTLSGKELALGVALYGTSALAVTSDSTALRQYLKPLGTEVSWDASDAVSGGSCGGDGGCSGGDGCGGGCGGCGGGD